MIFLCKHVSFVRTLVVSLALLAGSCSRLGAEDNAPKPEDIFPDTTFAAFALPDLSAARKAAEAGRMGVLFKQPEMREFLDPILARMKESFTEARNLNPMIPAFDDLDKSILSGEIAVCVYSHGPGIPPGVFVSIKPKDMVAFGHIMDAFKPILQDKPQDQPFALGPPNGPGMMLTKDRVMVCYPLTDMAAITDRITDAAKRAKGTLGATANFKEARAAMKDSAGWFYANPSTLLALAEEAAAANGGEESAKVKVILNALGLDKLNSILTSLTFAGGEPNMEVYVGADDVAASKGIFALIGSKGPAKELLQIASLDSPYVAGGSVNFSAIFPLLRNVVAAIEPNALQQMEGLLAQGNAMVKFDIEKDFIGNLEPDFVSAQTPNDTAVPLTFSPGMAGAMRLKNGAKFAECLAKLKTFADEKKLGEKIPALYAKFGAATYKGNTIYYISQVFNGGLAMCVVKDKLIFGNSLNAAKHGLDQMAASSNILANKDFQTAMARVGGVPFDADKMPMSFAYSTDRGSGGGVLLLTGLGIGAGTAALGGISEALNQGQDLAVEPDGFMPPFDELTRHAGGRTAMRILGAADLNVWPDEDFFIKYRQGHASIGLRTAKGWMSRSEIPPPMPQYGSAASLVPIALVAIGMASFGTMRQAQMQQAQMMQMQAQVQPIAPPRAARQGRLAGGNNLIRLHQAILTYEIDKNAFPTNPADLYPTYVEDLGVFKNPAQPNEDAGYTLVTGVSSENPNDILAYENPVKGGAPKPLNVLKTNGAVEQMSDDELQKALKTTAENVKKAGKKFATVPISVKEISKKKKE